MKRNILSQIAGIVAVAVLASVASFAVTSEANAATCSVYVAASVTGYTNDPDLTGNTCAIGSAGTNDSVVDLNLIGAGGELGGFTNWMLIGSVGSPTADLTIGGSNAPTYTTGTTESLDGTWSIADALYATYSIVAFVMKDGEGKNIVPDTWVAYLTNLANNAGVFRSAFLNTNPDPNQPTEISHFSLYGILAEDCLPTDPLCSSQTPIPLPAAFPLFATALGGLGLLGWRRRRKAAA